MSDADEEKSETTPPGERQEVSDQPVTGETSGPPAGWYVDKGGDNRWWNGESWGEQTKGKSRAKRFTISKRAVVISIFAIVVVVLVTLTISVLRMRHEASVASARSAASASAASASQEAEQAATEAAEESASAERKARHALVKDLQHSITKTAKKDVREGTLDGPIKHTSCTPTGGGSVDDLTGTSGTFDCIAVNKDNGDGTESGYQFAGTIDWGSGQYSWQLGSN